LPGGGRREVADRGDHQALGPEDVPGHALDLRGVDPGQTLIALGRAAQGALEEQAVPEPGAQPFDVVETGLQITSVAPFGLGELGGRRRPLAQLVQDREDLAAQAALISTNEVSPSGSNPALT
jgi:hypothetical protein